MQKTDELRKKIETDEDFVVSPSHKNSLRYFISKNPDGVSNDKIAKLLMISETEVEEAYQSALLKLKDALTKGK